VAFKFSVLSIITLNNLPAACDNLVIGQELLIPQPTPTSTSLPTITPNPATQTAEACERVDYTVQEGDTLGTIANSYNVPMEAIREYNGLPNDTVFLGMPLTIPLCARPTPIGPTATPTPPPPYAAPPLLLPQDGAPFTLADDSIALQWGSVGTLRDNEAYQIIVEDVTEGKGRRLIDYVTDTKYLVPSSFRLSDNVVHTFRWWVVTVRQTGTDTDGNPIWEPAGVASAPRVFTWSGAGKPPSPTP
jgi:LysM repeat protein